MGKTLRLWLTLMISGAVSLTASSPAIGQLAEAVSDALIVQNLAPELEGVQLGRIETLPEDRRRVIGAEEELLIGTEEGLGFRFERDLDSDGQHELVLLGSYMESDTRRSFVLIASPSAGQSVRSRLFTFHEAFVIGRFGRTPARRGDLAVFFCTGCDYGGWIEWTGFDFEYNPFPPAGVD